MLTYHHSIVLMLIAMLVVVNAQAAVPGEPRLKFRGKGPVCSCATGMGEEDIRKAWEARFAQPEMNRPESSDRRTTPSDEQRREIDELQAK